VICPTWKQLYAQVCVHRGADQDLYVSDAAQFSVNRLPVEKMPPSTVPPTAPSTVQGQTSELGYARDMLMTASRRSG